MNWNDTERGNGIDRNIVIQFPKSSTAGQTPPPTGHLVIDNNTNMFSSKSLELVDDCIASIPSKPSTKLRFARLRAMNKEESKAQRCKETCKRSNVIPNAIPSDAKSIPPTFMFENSHKLHIQTFEATTEDIRPRSYSRSHSLTRSYDSCISIVMDDSNEDNNNDKEEDEERDSCDMTERGFEFMFSNVSFRQESIDSVIPYNPQNQNNRKIGETGQIKVDKSREKLDSQIGKKFDNDVDNEVAVSPTISRQKRHNILFALCVLMNIALTIAVIMLCAWISSHVCGNDDDDDGGIVAIPRSDSEGYLESKPNPKENSTSLTDLAAISSQLSKCIVAKFDKAIFHDDCIECSTNMAIDGNHTIVTSSNDQSIYFLTFQNNTWEEVTRIAMDSSNSDMPVAIMGHLAVVGAPHEEHSNENAGVVYLFEKNLDTGIWDQSSRLSASYTNDDYREDFGIVSKFGQSVAIDDDLVIVGAHAELGKYSPTYFYRRNVFGAWFLEEMIPVLDHHHSVDNIDINGNLVLTSLSSSQYETSTEGKGSILIYEQNSQSEAWQKFQFILNNYDDCRYFGNTAKILNDRNLMIGCVKKDGTKIAYQYSRLRRSDKYTFQQEISLSLPENQQNKVDIINREWFAVDDESNVMVSTLSATSASIFFQLKDTWSMVGNIEPKYGHHFRGGIALSGDKLLLETEANVHAYSLEKC